MSGYEFAVENGTDNFDELKPLYRKHYGEMRARLAADGIEVAPFDMRLDVYMEYWRAGNLVNYTVRLAGRVVGYCNIYLTNDMHNGEYIAQEDALYLMPEHRNGTGRLFSKFILGDLKERGVKRLNVSAVTDLRVGKLWLRMGFKPVAQMMTYTF